MKAAELLVKCLENEGVDYIFGVPGEENIAVMDALLDSKIKFVVTRHETGAAFMAGMMGKLTGKPGVCLATLGPGATNMLTGVADANMDKSPIVAITGQAGLKRQHKASHQAYDIVSMYRPVTKWNASIREKGTIPEIIRKAFKVAMEEKQGATHVEFPEDIAGQEVKEVPIQPRHVDYPLEATQKIQKAAEVISRAQTPIILAGNGVIRGKAAEAMRLFAEKLQAPVSETFMGKGAMSNDHPLFTMPTGFFEKDYVDYAFETSDLIIAIGVDMTELPPENYNSKAKLPIIHIDFDHAEVDALYLIEQSVVGDIRGNLTELTRAIKQRTNPPAYLRKLKSHIKAELSQNDDNQQFPLKPQKVISDMLATFGPDDVIISDVGAHKMWLGRLYQSYRPNTCLISNGLASMGYALPGAIAAKLVFPNKRVVAVVGDGGFMMTGSELETAVRLKLPIIILIWRDGGYGLIEWKELKAFHRTSHISFTNPNFVQLAKAFGAEGFHVKDAAELKEILIKSKHLNGPVVIDCPVDYKENMNLSEILGTINERDVF